MQRKHIQTVGLFLHAHTHRSKQWGFFNMYTNTYAHTHTHPNTHSNTCTHDSYISTLTQPHLPSLMCSHIQTTLALTNVFTHTNRTCPHKCVHTHSQLYEPGHSDTCAHMHAHALTHSAHTLAQRHAHPHNEINKWATSEVFNLKCQDSHL